MRNKKAFEIQFNWIFVLIAGAAILIFFASIIVKQKNLNQSSINIEMLKQMENIISGASVSTDTVVPLDIPNFEIKISCNKVSIGSSSSQYQNLILFAPSPIKGSRLITQTLAFQEPYRSANLLFITSTQVKYILIGSDETFKEINKTLPAELDKEAFDAYDSSKIRNTNNYKIKFVFFNANIPSSLPASLGDIPDNDITAIKINGDIGKGSIDFYRKNGKSLVLKENSAYLGESPIIAAIYAERPEFYRCNMNNVFSKNSLVAKVYKGKIQELVAFFTKPEFARPECRQVYTDSLPNLNKIEIASSKLGKAAKIEASDINDILTSSELLAEQNKDAQKYTCPVIY